MSNPVTTKISMDELADKAADHMMQDTPASVDHPFAWVIPGDYNAKDDGWLDCRINREGEFTKPLYDQRTVDALRSALTAAEKRVNELEYSTEVAMGHIDNERYGAARARLMVARYAKGESPLDMSGQMMGDPHPLDLVANGQCPICGGFEGDHKPGCEDGSERI